MSGVRLESINKYYGQLHVVKDVNLSLGEDEFAVLVGPSGCGKSTTLRMIAGLETISSGQLYIGGQPAKALSPAERDIAMVFQNYALYPNMSVYDNLAFGLRNRKYEKAKIEEAVGHAAKILGIEPLLKRKPRQLSGGQQQRVALGRCLVRHPKVFLFDEPLSNLDAKLRLEMRQELKRLRTRIDATSVYVTHDQVEAMTLGDRVIVMDGGVIKQIGTPEEIFHWPENMFVAAFIGSPSMNFLHAELETAGGKTEQFYAKGDGFRFSLTEQAAFDLRETGKSSFTIGVRPEDIEVVNEGGDVPEAKIDLSEMLGAEKIIEAFCGEERITIARADPFRTFKPGEVITLRTNPNALHLFDTQTGERIGSRRDGRSTQNSPHRPKPLLASVG